MQRVLSLDQAPPLAVPLRFFLTAPLFAIAAAALLLYHGPIVMHSRWLPSTLAATHLLTLGFLSMAMVGALLQILQVVAGVTIPRLRATASVVHVSLGAGTPLLAAGFMLGHAWLFQLAMIGLGTGFAWLLIAIAIGMRGCMHASASFFAMRLSLAGLAVTVTLGLAAASAFGWGIAVPMELLTNLHAGWGMLAWIGLLVVGVAYQVVPMFQVTEAYPKRTTRYLASILVGALVLWSISYGFGLGGALLPRILLGVAAAGFAWFGLVTIALIYRRKRPQWEATTWFWYLSLSSLLAAIALWALAQWYPALANASAYPLALGILILVGFAYSLVNGMLYKIVPFLIWYHLQEAMAPHRMKAPNVRQIIDDRVARLQFLAQALALVLLLAATVYPTLARAAGVVFGAAALLLLWLLARAALRYRDGLRRLPT